MKQFIILCDLKQLFDKKHEHNVYRSCFNTNKCLKKKSLSKESDCLDEHIQKSKENYY